MSLRGGTELDCVYSFSTLSRLSQIPSILCALHLMYVICTRLYKCVISELLFMAEWWASTDLIIYIDKEDLEQYYGKEHGFLIMNHRYEVDWLMGWVLCDRINILGVSCCHFLLVFCVIVYLLHVYFIHSTGLLLYTVRGPDWEMVSS